MHYAYPKRKKSDLFHGQPPAIANAVFSHNKKCTADLFSGEAGTNSKARHYARGPGAALPVSGRRPCVDPGAVVGAAFQKSRISWHPENI